MKKYWYLLLLFILVAVPLNAQDARQRTVGTIVQDVLAQMPTQDAKSMETEMADLAKNAPKTVEMLVGMMKPAESHSNNLVEYALSGVVSYASAHKEYRQAVLDGLKAGLPSAADSTARNFIESQIRLLGEYHLVIYPKHKGFAPYAKQYDRLSSAKDGGYKITKKALRSADRAVRVQALQFVGNGADKTVIDKVAALYDGLKPEARKDVLYFLGDNHVVSQTELVLQAVKDGGEPVPAAIEAASKLGGPLVVPVLVDALEGTHADLAQTALCAVKEPLDEVMTSVLRQSKGDKAVRLLQIAGSRGVHQAASEVLSLCTSSDKTLSDAAKKALTGVVSDANSAQIADLLNGCSAQDVSVYQQALSASLGKKTAEERYSILQRMMSSSTHPERYFMPLSHTNVRGAVDVLTAKWRDASVTADVRGQALKALAACQNYAAAPVLLEAARKGESFTLRPYVQLVNTFETDADSRYNCLYNAYAVAKDKENRELVISSLGNTPILSSFVLVGKALDDAEVAYPSALALREIAEKCVDDIDYNMLSDRLTKAQEVLRAHGSADDGYAIDAIKKVLSESKPSPVYELSAEEKAEGFELLFDGTNLDKWVGDKTGYTPVNGTIYVTASYGNARNLYTEREYRDFVFRFEFSFTRPGANNGVGIRTPMGVDAAYDGMCEIQILDHDDPIYADLNEYQVHGSAYGIIPAKRIKHKPLGEWSTEEIRVKGDHITVTVNGEVIMDGDLRKACQGHNVSTDGSDTNPYTVDHRNHPGMFNKKGHVGFLGHGAGVKFRNVRILELK